MPRSMPAEKAANEIIRMISSGEATDAKDAVQQRPELAAGETMMKDAVKEKKTPKKSVGKRLAAAATGSGPARLSR